jgi:hypothetical protein
MIRTGTVARILISCGLAMTTLALAQTKKNQTIVTYPFGFALSQQVSDLPVSELKFPGQEIHEPGPRPLRLKAQTGPWRQEDPVLQKEVRPLVAASQGISFAGIPSPGYVPSDSNMAIGPNYIVEVVNVQFAVYNKTGTTIAGPTDIQTLFNPLGGNCGGTVGDPIVLYDRQADRWVITMIGAASSYAECVAVSQTNNPAGSYYLYGYSFGSNLNDYDKLSTWATASNSAYLATYNIFQDAETFIGADLCGLDRTKMLAGDSSAAQLCQMTPSSEFGYLPSDMDGPTPPVDGTPGLYISWFDNDPGQLYLRSLTLDFATATATLSPATSIAVANDSYACSDGGQCIPQEGTSQTLDSLGDRLMYRFAIRHFPDHDRAVVNHAVANGSQVAVRWYEIYDPAGSVTLNQQGTFAPDSTYRWMASLAEDQNMDIGLGYSASSSSIYPGIRFTGRVPTDPLGTMETEANILTGTGAQVGSDAYRWGDYTAMQVDPSDDCTFWYVDQYQQINGTFDWDTNISSFIFSGCGVQNPNFSLSANPGSVTVAQGNSVTSTITVNDEDGFSGSVQLSASGLPSGVTAQFVPNPTTTTSTLTLSASGSAATGTVTVTVSGVSGTLNNSTTLSLTVNPVVTGVAVSPTALSFSTTVVGATSKAKTTTLTNSSSATLDISSITTSGDFAQSTSTKPCGATLAAGKSCVIDVTFTPTQTGSRTGTLSVNDNASNSPQTVTLSGTGEAQAALTPATATFTATVVGKSSTAKVFTLKNNQSVILKNLVISTTGPFSVSSTTCQTQLTSNASCTIDVKFTPTGVGVETGTVQVSDSANNSPQVSNLTGTGKN